MNTIASTLIIELDKYSILFRDDEIIQVNLNPFEDISVDEIKEGRDEVIRELKGEKYPVLFMANDFTLPSKEAREYLASPNGLIYSLADAYCISSFSQQIIGNFYLSVNKPHRPTKMFTNKEQAVKWLKSFL